VHRIIQPSSGPSKVAAWAIAFAGEALRPLKFKGYWHIARVIGKTVPESQECVVSLTDKSKFRFSLRDAYWSRLVSKGYSYEPEIAHVIRMLDRKSQILFLDCGANFGYWSVLVSEEIPAATVIAVEASPRTFQHLVLNKELNGNRFTAINKALFSKSEKIVRFAVQGHHASASIESDGVEVQTVTIDDLVSSYAAPYDAVVIKLDVEGVEQEAIAGGLKTITSGRECVLIFEDHGKDKHSEVTEYVLATGLLSVFFIDEGGRPSRISTAAEASAIKTKSKRGYNFVACTEGHLMDRIRRQLVDAVPGRPRG
jgi:FkbM family methyltransferase